MLVECSREIAFEQLVVQNCLGNHVADEIEVPEKLIDIKEDSHDLQFVSWIDIGIRVDSVGHAVVSSLGE